MSAVTVSRASEPDWQVVRQVRLRALEEAPYAFGSTLARELAFDEREWRRRVAPGNWFLARAQGLVVGVAAAVIEDDHPAERHLVAMWVQPEHRGTATAAQLVEAVCGWASAAGASAVSLWVADGNPRARRLYERLGFRATGERQPLPSAPHVAEERMRRQLPPARDSR